MPTKDFFPITIFPLNYTSMSDGQKLYDHIREVHDAGRTRIVTALQIPQTDENVETLVHIRDCTDDDFRRLMRRNGLSIDSFFELLSKLREANHSFDSQVYPFGLDYSCSISAMVLGQMEAATLKHTPALAMNSGSVKKAALWIAAQHVIMNPILRGEEAWMHKTATQISETDDMVEHMILAVSGSHARPMKEKFGEDPVEFVVPISPATLIYEASEKAALSKKTDNATRLAIERFVLVNMLEEMQARLEKDPAETDISGIAEINSEKEAEKRFQEIKGLLRQKKMLTEGQPAALDSARKKVLEILRVNSRDEELASRIEKEIPKTPLPGFA